jgi:hypothetical protein
MKVVLDILDKVVDDGGDLALPGDMLIGSNETADDIRKLLKHLRQGFLEALTNQPKL